MKKILLLLCLTLTLTLTACNSSNSSEEAAKNTYIVSFSPAAVSNEINGLRIEVDDIKAKIQSGTDDAADTAKKDIAQLKVNMAEVDAELEAAVKDNKITMDAKKEYDKLIEGLKTELDSVNTTLENDEKK